MNSKAYALFLGLGLTSAVALMGSGEVSGQAENKLQALLLNEDEIAAVISHGPWPTTTSIDPTNRVSGNPNAIKLGELLFFDKRFSANGEISCASCHSPDLGWTDGKTKAGGLERLDRNTQSLFNVRGNRWFGWDGRNDSLWAHSIGPILDEREMGATPELVSKIIHEDEKLQTLYQGLFDISPAAQKPLDVVVNAAKAIAAFQETITTGKTPFDEFRDALATADYATAINFPASAQRGAAIFVGRGNCSLCHLGPRFSNDEFDDAGVPYFTGPGQVDKGRFKGIKSLKASPFNKLGIYNDAKSNQGNWPTAQIAQTHRTFGQFRVPSLRQLTQTAPYMHDGSLATLEDVANHYSNINLNRIHQDGALILRPLDLNEQETKDLVAFLKSLSTTISD